MWWVLSYLEVYERRRDTTGLDGLAAPERYRLILARFGGGRPATAADPQLPDSRRPAAAIAAPSPEHTYALEDQ
jgi:hypothetical protein